jgi:chromosomal replication initiation ATPase DnaA
MIDYATKVRLTRLHRDASALVLQIKEIISENNTSTSDENRKWTSNDIVEGICHFYHIPREGFLKYSRKRDVVLKKQIAIKLLKEQCGYSYWQIADIVGYKQHATCIHHYNQVNQDLSDDYYGSKEVKEQFNDICNFIGI